MLTGYSLYEYDSSGKPVRTDFYEPDGALRHYTICLLYTSTYTVKKGDIWPTICTNFCGDNAQRYKLMKVNKNVKLADGEVITLPEKLGKDTLIPAAVANEGETLYLSLIHIFLQGRLIAADDSPESF